MLRRSSRPGMKCDEQKTECATHTPHHPAMAKFPDDLSGCGETPPCGDASWMHPHHTPPVGERGLGEGGGSHPSSPPPCEGGAGTFWGTRGCGQALQCGERQQSTGEAWKSRLTTHRALNPPSSISHGSRHGSRLLTPLLVVRNVRYRRFGHASPYAIEPILSVQHPWPGQEPG